MITIYSETDTVFESLGLGTLAPTTCTIEEELNGMYELEMEHPYDIDEKYKRLENNRILKIEDISGKNSFFRIYRITHTLKNIKIFARHLSYDLMNIYVDELAFENLTLRDIVSRLEKERSKSNQSANGMIVSSLDQDAGGRTIPLFKVENTNLLKVILGTDGEQDSMVKEGCEILRHGDGISIFSQVGQDHGVQIRYGKNLVGLSVEDDWSNTINRVYPIGKDGIKLPEKYIDSDNIQGRIKASSYKFDEVENVTELRQKAKIFVNQAALPIINIKADIKLLSGIDEYKDFKGLTTVRLGDTVTVINQRMNFKKQARVIRYKWNVLTKKYINVELGDFIQDITRGLDRVDQSFQMASTALEKSNRALASVDGKIKITDEYIYIPADGIRYENATKIYRFGRGGLSYGKNGVRGAFKTIFDENGELASEYMAGSAQPPIISNPPAVAATTGLKSVDGAFVLQNDWGASYLNVYYDVIRQVMASIYEVKTNISVADHQVYLIDLKIQELETQSYSTLHIAINNGTAIYPSGKIEGDPYSRPIYLCKRKDGKLSFGLEGMDSGTLLSVEIKRINAESIMEQIKEDEETKKKFLEIGDHWRGEWKMDGEFESGGEVVNIPFA